MSSLVVDTAQLFYGIVHGSARDSVLHCGSGSCVMLLLLSRSKGELKQMWEVCVEGTWEVRIIVQNLPNYCREWISGIVVASVWFAKTCGVCWNKIVVVLVSTIEQLSNTTLRSGEWVGWLTLSHFARAYRGKLTLGKTLSCWGSRDTSALIWMVVS